MGRRSRFRGALTRLPKGQRAPKQISDRVQTPPGATGRNQRVRKREQFSGSRRFR